MVHPAFLLLASCAARAGAVSLCLADPSAVSHRGDRGGWRPVVSEVDFFPSGTNFARTARHLINGRLFVSK